MRANFVLSGVWAGIRRNLGMTIALILNTALLLAFVGVSLLANKEITKFGDTYEGKLNVSVFLCTDLSRTPCTGKTTPAEQAAVNNALRIDPIVATSHFVTAAQNTDRAKRTSPKGVADQIGPDTLPASFTVKLRNISRDYDAFYKKYSSFPGVSQVTNEISAIRTLLDILNGLKNASIIVALVVLIASILLIANTIQVAAAQRRNETSIMRLVGASRWMAELPFMLETVVATIVGGLVAFGMVTVGKYFLLNNIFAGQVESGVIPDLNLNDLVVASGVSLIGGIVLGALTAFATLRLYVKL